ncbi:hypothetical protein HN588_04295 [Candidatus Bathyarchaeota archaeon]|nr:hypothetical protein [Candidatus Bathyarchaeota archaeon]
MWHDASSETISEQIEYIDKENTNNGNMLNESPFLMYSRKISDTPAERIADKMTSISGINMLLDRTKSDQTEYPNVRIMVLESDLESSADLLEISTAKRTIRSIINSAMNESRLIDMVRLTNI